MKGTTNAQRNAVVSASGSEDNLRLTMADGAHTDVKVSDMIPKDAAPVSGSQKFVTSGAVYSAIDNLKVSDLTNDSGFITNTVNNLTNYYTKTQTYTKTEVNNLIGNINSFDVSIVASLPTTGNVHTIYLVPQSGGSGQNIKDEYLWVDSKWEKIGSTDFKLTITQNASGISINGTALQSADASKAGLMTAAQVTALNGKQNKLVAAGSATKPIFINSSGVPTAINYTLGAACEKSIDSAPTSGSTALVTSGGVFSAINVVDLKVPTSGVFSEGTDGDGQIVFKHGSSDLFTVTGITGGGSSSTANVAITLESSISASNSNVTVTATPAVGTAKTSTTDSTGVATFKGLPQGSWTFSANGWQSQSVNLVGGFQTSLTLAAQAEVYGFRIAVGTSDPSARVGYPATIFGQINKASGKTPASGTGANCMNGWAGCSLIKDIKRQKGHDSTWTDIVNSAAWQAGDSTNDIMTYVPTWYLKMTNDGSSIDVAFSSIKIDDTWKDLAGSVGSERKGHFRVGCFGGYNSSSRLYSRGSVKPTVDTSITSFISFAKARGSGYDIMTWYQWTYLTALAVLLYKSTNLQTAMAQGYVGGSSVQTENTLTFANQYGMAGGTSTTQQMSFFWIQNLWGNMYQFVGGAKTNSSYKFLGQTGYSSVNEGDFDIITSTGSSLSGGYISKVAGTTDCGFFPTEISGSKTTYFADGGVVYTSYFPYVGGSYDGGGYAGPFNVYFNGSATNTNSAIGSRLSYRL